MSTPFGGHPTLGKYMAWASNEGMLCQTGPLSVIIKNPNGGHVIIPHAKQAEHLAPSTVAYYDRRLGVDSPFPKPASYE